MSRLLVPLSMLSVSVAGLLGGERAAFAEVPGPLVYAVDVSAGTGDITRTTVNCWYGQGVRHVIVSANSYNTHFVNQMTTVAAKPGMGLSAYVYLYHEGWGSIYDQIVAAMNRLKNELPGNVRGKVQRLWLDYENHPPEGAGPDYVLAKIQDGVNTLRYYPMGIYTRASWWIDYTGNTPRFGDVPLWYAYWDGVRSLETWYDGQAFGSWPEPVGKQYLGEARLSCSGNDLDLDYIHVGNTSGLAAATLRSPKGYARVLPNEQNRITLSWNDVAGESRWRVEVERFRDGDYWFEAHQTLAQDTTSSTWGAPHGDTQYRWRVIGLNNYGGGWSGWGVFNYGNPAVPSVPATIDPTGNESIGTPSVTLIAGATGEDYQFQIQHDNNRDGEWSQWRYVVRDDAIHPNPNLYAFRPPYRGVPYRWRVQAKNGSGWSRWSSWAYFLVL